MLEGTLETVDTPLIRAQTTATKITRTKIHTTAEISRTTTDKEANLPPSQITIIETTNTVTVAATTHDNTVYLDQGTTIRTASIITNIIVNPNTIPAPAVHQEIVTIPPTITKTQFTLQDMEPQMIKIELPNGHQKTTQIVHQHGVMIQTNKMKKEDMNHDLGNPKKILGIDQPGQETEVLAQDEYTLNFNLELPALKITTHSK